MVDANINNYWIPTVYTLLCGCFLTGFHALWDLPLHFSKSLNLCDLILCQSPSPITLFSHSGHFLFPDCSEFFPTTGPSHLLSPMSELLSTLLILFRPSNFNLTTTSWKSKALARSHSFPSQILSHTETIVFVYLPPRILSRARTGSVFLTTAPPRLSA